MISGAERLRDFNAQRCDRKVVSFGIFEKKFGFYPAELDRFCVIVFGMRALAQLRGHASTLFNQSFTHSCCTCTPNLLSNARPTHAQRTPNKLNQNLNLIIHSLGNCRQSQTSSDISWRSVNSSSGSGKLLVSLTKSCQCCLF